MDLSDGSDVEGDVNLADENALLGSDDEDANYLSHKEEYEDVEHITLGEDGDVLDLELHNDDDGLEFEDEPDGCLSHSRVAPVQVRSSAISHQSLTTEVEPNTDTNNYQHQLPADYDNYDHDEYAFDGSVEADFDEDEDDDDSRNTRMRFHSERKTENISSHHQSNSFGNPIQTVGAKTTVEQNRQRNWPRNPNYNQNMGPRHRNPLLGNRPQNCNRPRNFRMNGPPVVQFQGGIFTDFNQPPRIPNPHNPQMIIREQGPPFPGPRLMCNAPPPNGNFNVPLRQNNMRMPIRNQGPHMRPRGAPNMQRHPGHHLHHNHQWRNARPPPRPQFQRFPMNQVHGPPNNMPFMPSGQQMFSPEAGIPPPMFMEHGMRSEMPPQMQFNSYAGPMQPGPPQMGYPSCPSGPGMSNPSNMPPLGAPDISSQNIPQQTPFYVVQQHQPNPHFMQQQSSQPAWPQHEPVEHHLVQNSWNSPGGSQHFMSGSEIVNHVMSNGNFLQEKRISDVSYATQSIDTKSHLLQPLSYEQEKYGHNYTSDSNSPRHNNSQHEYSTPQSDWELRGFDKVAKSSHERRKYDYDDKERDERYLRHHDRDRYSSTKRKFDKDSHSPRSDKLQRLNDRLGPPARKASPPPIDEKTEELLKIREESKKTIGLDDEYIKKLEEQQKLREEILRKKAASRKKQIGADDEGDTKTDKQNLPISPKKSSIYINPKAFSGDLSALKRKPVNNVQTEGSASKLTSIKSKTSTVGLTNKPRMVLKIVKDKYGNILSKSKVIYVPKQQQEGRTTSA